MKISEQRKKEYEIYLNSPQAKLERFLDKLEEERLGLSYKPPKKYNNFHLNWPSRRHKNE